MTVFLSQIMNGIQNGVIYASLGLAIVLIFRTTGILNFAQGEMALFCTYVVYQLGEWGVPIGFALILGMLVGFVLGAVTEVALVRPVAKAASGAKPVTVIVNTLSVPDARVTFPSFRQQGKTAWTGEFVGVPSFVHVAMPDSRVVRCGRPLEPNDDGGLTWRFALFVGIMVAWVPLYLMWARRPDVDGDA